MLAGRTPFIVVGPVKASPLKWVQPLIDRANENGTFSGLVYLGESHNGARQWSKIYVYACASDDHFAEGDGFADPPDDCEVSEPVEVYRNVDAPTVPRLLSMRARREHVAEMITDTVDRTRRRNVTSSPN